MGSHEVNGAGDGVVAALITARNGAWLVEWASSTADLAGADAADGFEAATLVALAGAEPRGFVGPFRFMWTGERVWSLHAGAQR